MIETSMQPDPFPTLCPKCGHRLFLAAPDTTVPSYPTYSEIIPVPELWCPACHLSWTASGGSLVRTGTALAQARHELRQIRRERRAAEPQAFADVPVDPEWDGKVQV